MERLAARLACLFLIVGTVVAAPAAAQDVPNPAYEAWSKFKPGATARIVGSTKTMGMETTVEITTKLVEITPQQATVEVSAVINAGGNKMEQPAERAPVAARVKQADSPAPVGEEEVTLDGKKYRCRVYELKRTEDGTTVVARTWMSDEVPGGIVKVESSTQGAVVSDTRFELKEFKAE